MMAHAVRIETVENGFVLLVEGAGAYLRMVAKTPEEMLALVANVEWQQAPRPLYPDGVGAVSGSAR